jgi:hypothetical protein
MRRIAIAIGIGIGAGLAAYLLMRPRKAQQFSAGNGFTVVLNEYNGKYKDEPGIKDYQRRFNDMVKKAVKEIPSDLKQLTGKDLPEPPITVTVELDDSFESDPFIVPSAATQCPAIPYKPGQGNCASYTIRMGAKPISEKYKGRTKVDKITKHELTHIWLLYHIPDHDSLPDYLIEGIPIHISGQEEEIKAVQREKPKGNHNYNEGEIHVDKYGELIDEFHKKVLNE